MKEEAFIAELKEKLCHADWHKRYFTEKARQYHGFDYWLKSVLGFIALIGAALVPNSNPTMALLGGFMAACCAFILGNVIPIFKWEAIVSGFKDEQEEWTRIYQGYGDLLRIAMISDRGEILLQEFQRVMEMQKTAALEERSLPQDRKLLARLEKEVREFYHLDLSGN